MDSLDFVSRDTEFGLGFDSVFRINVHDRARGHNTQRYLATSLETAHHACRAASSPHPIQEFGEPDLL